MSTLLLAGFCCQSFSISGKQLGFEDERGKLFFNLVEALNTLKPDYFLIENVIMKKDTEKKISELIGVDPIEINSGLVSAQNRRRLYWTNIPNISLPKDKNLTIKDILEDNVTEGIITNTPNRTYTKNYMQYDMNNLGNKSQDQRAYYINTKSGTLDTGCAYKQKVYINDNLIRQYTQTELERLQTLPEGYTSCVSKNKAGKAIGNGWTVDVIAHILSNIPNKEVNTVVSLFDGISCGRIALDRANVRFDKYLASEIDKTAIQISQANWNDIEQIGDVTKIDWGALKEVL